MKKNLVLFQLAFACTILFAENASGWADDVPSNVQRHITGVLTDLSDGSLSVSRGNQIFEFERTEDSEDSTSDLHAGDFVTVWYKVANDGETYEELRVKKISSSHRGQSGQAAPEAPQRSPVSPTLDDRAFYDAQNEVSKKSR